jgi:FkbM family methyltransferase
MITSTLNRVTKRIREDCRILFQVKNWEDILRAKLQGTPIKKIIFRNGVVINSPEQVDLNFLFHEIWIERLYSPKGYEIKDNYSVVDIGANIGVFALYAATFAQNVRVRAFEPFPTNAEYFSRNTDESRADNVEFLMAAVADSAGVRKLHVEDLWILHSLTAKGSTSSGIEVACVSLSEAISGFERCDLLKIDCEGAEYEILYSASPETLSKIRRIVCEFNIGTSEGENGECLAQFLVSHGFHIDSLRTFDETAGFLYAKR